MNHSVGCNVRFGMECGDIISWLMSENSIFFKFSDNFLFFNFYLFIFGYIGSLFLCEGFL